MTTWLVAGLAGALLTPAIIHRLSRADQPSRSEGEWRVCEYSGGLVGCVSLCGVLFLFLSVFAYSHPGSTPASQLTLALGFFALMGLLGLYTAWQMGRSRVLWNDREICSKGVRISWQELEGANFLAAAQGYQLVGPEGKKIWVYQAMNGFPEFWAKVEEFLSRA
ncbi:hypothetical protein JST97_34185 [bacterium]|nr:hypothetical protein [bacterium]